MKNTTLFLFLLFAVVSSCKAQNYPLNTYSETIPNNAHLKDMDNILEKYSGVWKAVVGNKEVYLYITKQNDRKKESIDKEYYEDVLLIKFKIIINNQEVESTISFSDDKINMISNGTDIDESVSISYKGGICRIGWGMINLKYIDQTHIKWNYYPQSVQITNINCPNNPGNLDIYLPYEPDDIIFTKQ